MYFSHSQNELTNNDALSHAIEISDLPVVSPLCNAVLKNLENWEQLLLDKMNRFDGPPPNYINTYPTDLSAGGGPAILRHKAMLEPDNTPFKSVC